MNLAGAIRAELGWRGWTITDLAEKSGINQPTLSKRLNGDSKFLWNDILAIAGALDIPAWELVRRADREASVA